MGLLTFGLNLVIVNVLLLVFTTDYRSVTPSYSGTGFHLEGKPEVDDVFGDASDYRRTIDRFIDLATQMQAMRDEFARSVQSALTALVV